MCSVRIASRGTPYRFTGEISGRDERRGHLSPGETARRKAALQVLSCTGEVRVQVGGALLPLVPIQFPARKRLRLGSLDEGWTTLRNIRALDCTCAMIDQQHCLGQARTLAIRCSGACKTVGHSGLTKSQSLPRTAGVEP